MVNFPPLSKSFFSRLKQCQLCRKVTISVFLSILVVEAIILIPSYRNYEKDELGRIEQAALYSLVTLLETHGELELSSKTLAKLGEKLTNITSIRGITILHKNGDVLLKLGETPGPHMNRLARGSHWYTTLRSENGQRYDVAWYEQELKLPFQITARLDTSHIDRILLAFILRIAGLVAVIASFVTIVTLLALNVMLLTPILNLRQHLLSAADDPTNPEQYVLDNPYKDEFGDLIFSFNKLLQRISKGLKDIYAHKQALETANESLEERVNLRTKELIHKNKELEQLTNYDVITELPNKNLFQTRIEQTISQLKCPANFHGILLLELNEFQEINDAYGNNIGDLLLKDVGICLSKHINNINTVGRISSFHLGLFTNVLNDLSDLADISQQILELFAKPFIIAEQTIATTINIGIAIAPRDGTDPKMLTINADLALARSKNIHPNYYHFYEEEMNKNLEFRHNMLVDLHYALEEQQLMLHYQPQVNLQSGKIIGMEALIRWQHPEKGVIPPGQFIPIAEESGLIVPIGKWVLKTACQQTKIWQQQGINNLRVAINLSAIQFKQENIVQVVQEILEETQLPSANLELEITESVVMDDVEAAINTMHELHSLGVLLSMDDFGTGYSSLSYLKRFPVQKIKIDQSFVRSINHETTDTNIADAVIYLGHSLKYIVIAEGVETEFQAEYVKKKKCDEAQGFYFGCPVSAKEFPKFFER